MRILLFGATGMVGYGVLRECLLAEDVSEVVTVGRRSLGRNHSKLTEIVVPDVADLDGVAEQLTGFDACFFCLGVSSVGMAEDKYRTITYDLTVSVAKRLAATDPGMTFVYVSGAGTDAEGKQMWARVKGATENAILAMPLRAFMFRPGIIQARHGAKPSSGWVRVAYTVLSPIIPVIRRFWPGAATATDSMGLAMLQLARNGGDLQLLDNKAINELAGSAAGPSS